LIVSVVAIGTSNQLSGAGRGYLAKG
jgi:hypothetical protein